MIGGTLANRVLQYRGWLGGFYNIYQVKEVYGISDSTFLKIKPYLKVAPFPITKISLNKADFNTLKAHPYTRKMAGLIIKYRENNGGFKTRAQFCRVPQMNDSLCNAILPYLILE